MINRYAFNLVFTLAITFLSFSISKAQAKLNVAVAGLNHDHIYLIMNSFQKGEVNIIGIAENNQELVERFKKRYKLADSIFFKDLPTLLQKRKPDAVLAYNAISDH